MKRSFALILVICLILCGCAGEQTTPTTSTTGGFTYKPYQKVNSPSALKAHLTVLRVAGLLLTTSD